MKKHSHDISTKQLHTQQCEHCSHQRLTKRLLDSGPGYEEWLNICESCGGWTRYAQASNSGKDSTWLLIDDETVFRIRIDAGTAHTPYNEH